MNHRLQRIIERLPLAVFMGMYFFSCYIGIVLLLTSSRFWAWTNLFISTPEHLQGRRLRLLSSLRTAPDRLHRLPSKRIRQWDSSGGRALAGE
jgi:hypothetical protein